MVSLRVWRAFCFEIVSLGQGWLADVHKFVSKILGLNKCYAVRTPPVAGMNINVIEIADDFSMPLGCIYVLGARVTKTEVNGQVFRNELQGEMCNLKVNICHEILVSIIAAQFWRVTFV